MLIFRYMTKYRNDDLRDLLEVTRALSDETRVRILMMLDIHELCVCQITAAMDHAPSTISKHLSILESADLISRRKVGRWVYYRLSHQSISGPLRDALQLFKASVYKSKDVADDRRKIKALLKEDINSICKRLYHDNESSGLVEREINGALIKA